MPCRVVIRAFTLRRDMGWALLLKRVLEDQGSKVIIACSRNYSWIIRVWKPHVAVINTVSQIESSRKNAPHSQLVHWPGEGGEPWEYCDARLLSQRPDLFSELSGIFSWGEDSLGQYKRAFPSQKLEKVILCGNPRLDVIKYDSNVVGDEVSSIGFATRFNSICHFDGRPTLYTLTREKNRLPVIAQVNGLVSTLRLIRLVLEETNNPISIRPHPLEAPEYYERYVKVIDPSRISIDTSYDFAQWVKKQKVVVTPASSSFAESYILGKPVINIDRLSEVEEITTSVNEYSKMNRPEDVNTPGSEGEFLNRLKVLIKEKKTDLEDSEDMRAHLLKTQCWPRDFSSIKKGADKITELGASNHNVPRWWPFQWAIEIKDYYDFNRRLKREPLHVNKNYSRWYHKEDRTYKMIAERIISGKPVM